MAWTDITDYGGSLTCYFDEKNILKLFPGGSSCQYASTIPEKNCTLTRPFKNRHFVRVCMKKMMHHQCKQNGARNIYSNNNQMRAYVECSPNQSKKLYLIDLSNEESTKH